MAIGVIYGPIGSGLIAAVAIFLVAAGLPVKNSSKERQVVTIIVSGIVSAGVIFAALLVMPLHGC